MASTDVVPGLDANSDVQVKVSWRDLDILHPPECAGIYAVTSAKKETWYYIGKSQNIAKRIIAKNHPIQVTKDANIDLHYWYLRVKKDHIGWLEKYLIRECNPEWNGSTAFGANSPTPWMCCDLPLWNTEETKLMILAAIGE